MIKLRPWLDTTLFQKFHSRAFPNYGIIEICAVLSMFSEQKHWRMDNVFYKK